MYSFNLIPITMFLSLCLSAGAYWSGTDAELVHEVEYRNWRFFRDAQGGEGTAHLFYGAGNYNGGCYGEPQLAGDGYGIASLCVGAYRGWMDEEEAYRRVLSTLKTYDTVTERTWFGYYNHWNNYYTGQPSYLSDTSGIDTAWFLCGALLAAEYFKGTEVEETANRIFNEVQWRNCQDPKTGYTEFLIITIIGSGSIPYAWNAPDCRNAWNESTRSTNYWAPLFVYQWPQNYVDFRHYRDDAGANHYEIMQDSIKTQRWKCTKLHTADTNNYKDFGPDGWGLTSATVSPLPGSGAPSRYLELAPWAKEGKDENYWTDSGTLSPICLPACMAHEPALTISAMRHMCNHYDRFGYYSFPNTLNTGEAASGHPFQCDGSASMDFGANVLAVENYRSGMPWYYFMRHPVTQLGMERCGLVKTIHVPWGDNFDAITTTNAWGGLLGTRCSDATLPSASYINIPQANEWVKGKALTMSADGAGDIVDFGLGNSDQSKKDMLSFWIRSASGNNDFSIILEDTSGHAATVHATNCWIPDGLSTDWTRLRVPLKLFAVTDDPNHDVRLTELSRLSFSFDAPGTLQVDDMAFLEDDIKPPPPTNVTIACVDGHPMVRWGHSIHDDVVGYHVWRNTEPHGNYHRVSTNLLSAIHTEKDNENLAMDVPYYYAVQCVDRRQNAGTFSSDTHPVSIVLKDNNRDLDWPDGQTPNTFGGNHGAWGDGSSIAFIRQTNSAGVTGWVRNCSASAGNGVYILLAGESIRDYDAIEFKIKSSDNLDDLRFGIKSTDQDEKKQLLTSYFRGQPEAGWQTIRIPLIDFADINLGSVENMSFTFNQAAEMQLDAVRFLRQAVPRQDALYREAETTDDYHGGNPDDAKTFASAGYVLGNTWANDFGDFSTYSNLIVSSDIASCYLQAGYAQDHGIGGVLRVKLNERFMGHLMLPPTGGWLDHASERTIAELPLGPLPAGNYTLKLIAEEQSEAVNLDFIQFTENPSEMLPLDTDCDGIPDITETFFGTDRDSADTDGDGLTDMEEVSYISGGKMSDPLSGNSDTDEYDDYAERLAGTDPTDAASYLQFTTLMNSAPEKTPQIHLKWQGSQNCNYTVLYCNQVTPPLFFTNITDPQNIFSTASNIMGYIDNGTGTTPNPNANTLRLYRIMAY